MLEAIAEKVVISDEVLEEFITLMEGVRDYQFAIGDRLNQLVIQHGGNKAEVIRYISGQLRISPSVLYDYSRISEKWSFEDRAKYQALDWTVYRNADPIEDADLLDKCIDEGWTATRFKEEKYPTLKEAESVLGRITGIVERYRRILSPDVQKEIDEIMDRLRVVLMRAKIG